MHRTHSANGKTVLVTGAAGLLGTAVVRRLLQDGYHVRAMTHRTQEGTTHPKLTILQGDINDLPFVRRAVLGVSEIIHLAARKSDERDSMMVNEGGARNLAVAAAAASVSRIMNISTQSVKLPQPGLYAASKAAADRVLSEGAVPVTTLHFSVIYGGKNDGIVGMLLRYAKLPIVPVIGHGNVSFAPIHRDDAALAIVRLLEKPDTIGRSYDAGGPEVYTFEVMLRMCGRALGKRKMLIVHIPIPIAMLIARLTKSMKRPPITVSNVLGSIANVPLDTSAFFRDIGFLPRSFAQGLSELFPISSEAHAILRYVLPSAPAHFPDEETVARYERALIVHGINDTTPSSTIVAASWKLRALDAATRILVPTCELQRKLLIAAAVAECTRESAPMLLPRDRSVADILRTVIGALASSLSAFSIGCFLLMSPSLRRDAGC